MQLNWYWKFFSDLTPSELYKALQLRSKVFVVEQNEVYLDADDKDFQAWHLLGSDDNNNLIAYARLLLPSDNSEKLSFGRVIVAPDYRRHGFATQLVKEIFSWIEQSPYSHLPVEISAQQYLETFYKKFGFQSEGDIYYEGKIPHIMMRCVLDHESL